MNPCRHCEAELAENALLCPGCDALVHVDELQTLHSGAREALASGYLAAAVDQFRACLELLPADTSQASRIRAEISQIEKRLARARRARPVNAAPARKITFSEARGITKSRIDELQTAARCILRLSALPSPIRNGVGWLADVAVWLASVSWMILSLIIRGLLNASTWRSLAAWVVLLGLMMGWTEAALFGAYVFLHETGHLVPVQYYGIGFRWPFFVPFVGAFVIPERLADRPSQNVAVSLGGPVGGIVPAVVVLLTPALTGTVLPGTVTEITALSLVIGLANLAPFWVLDGARIATYLTRPMLIAVAGMVALASWTFGSILGGLLAVAYIVRALLPAGNSEQSPDLRERCCLWRDVFVLGCTVAIAVPFVP